MDKKRKFTARQKLYIEASVLFLLTILIFIFWDTFIVYPIKILVVIFHEISHAIAGILTGEAVKSIKISADLSGKTITEGRGNFFVIFSGYFGSIFWGALILFSAYKRKYLKIISIATGIIIFLFTANVFKGEVSILFGLFFSLLFVLLPFLKYRTALEYFYKFIGLASMFYVLVDIKEDLLTFSFKQTDAFLLSTITGVAPLIWGLFYFVLALGVFIAVIFFAIKNSPSK